MKTFSLCFAIGFSFLVASSAAGADILDGARLKGRAPETVLWPSGEAELRAQPNSAIAALPDGAMGFVTVADAPYPELVQAARDMAATMYPRRFESR